MEYKANSLIHLTGLQKIKESNGTLSKTIKKASVGVEESPGTKSKQK